MRGKFSLNTRGPITFEQHFWTQCLQIEQFTVFTPTPFEHTLHRICLTLWLWRPATLLNLTSAQCFRKFCEIFKNTCFVEYLRTFTSKLDLSRFPIYSILHHKGQYICKTKAISTWCGCKVFHVRYRTISLNKQTVIENPYIRYNFLVNHFLKLNRMLNFCRF